MHKGSCFPKTAMDMHDDLAHQHHCCCMHNIPLQVTILYNHSFAACTMISIAHEPCVILCNNKYVLNFCWHWHTAHGFISCAYTFCWSQVFSHKIMHKTSIVTMQFKLWHAERRADGKKSS